MTINLYNMKTQSKISKKLCLLFFVILTFSKINSQPVAYSWNDRHGFDYISDAKDQKEQGPCGIFATVAAVEAMVQIYFNTTGSDLDLSESNLYSECGLHNFPAPQALSFFKTNGVIDNSSWQFPTSIVNGIPYQYYLPSPARNAYSTYSLKAKIPQWGYSFEADSTLIISTNENLKKAIMDYGPIIVMGSGANQNGDSLGLALHPEGPDVSHTVFITGLEIKPGSKKILKQQNIIMVILSIWFQTILNGVIFQPGLIVGMITIKHIKILMELCTIGKQ